MKRLTIKRYDELTDDQWRRIVASVKRHVGDIADERCEVGVGRKYTRGRPQGSQIAVRIYLSQKRKRVAESRRLPDPFRVRLRRENGTYELIEVRSDVETLGKYVATAARVSLGNRSAASGLLLRWQDRNGDRSWGFATAAHLFDGTTRRTMRVRFDAKTSFRCRRFKTAPLRERIDVAVLQITGKAVEIESKLKAAGLIRRANQAAVKWMSTRQVRLAATRQRAGKTYFVGGNESFVGEEVFPIGFRLGRRRLDDCIRVGQGRTGAFRKGTSGAYWTFGKKAACMQVGGKRPDFREGIGQPVDRYLEWLHKTLGDSASVVAVLD